MLWALPRYVKEKVSMKNIVTRVETVRVEFIVVVRRSLCRCFVEVVSNEYVKQGIIFDFAWVQTISYKSYCYLQTNNITFLHIYIYVQFLMTCEYTHKHFAVTLSRRFSIGHFLYNNSIKHICTFLIKKKLIFSYLSIILIFLSYKLSCASSEYPRRNIL